jgi:predicted RNase H-like HicB family nuclease
MSNLIFPIAIEPGDDTHAFGVVVPDLPGCFSAGDTLAGAYANAKDAIEAHLSVLIDESMNVPPVRALSDHRSNPEYANWLWGFVEVADIPALKRTVRLNISLPENLLHDIDEHAKTMHLTRSGFLAQAALKAMAR